MKAYDDLLFEVRVSVRYHSRRQGFFQTCHSLVMTLALFGSSATLATFGAELGAGWPLWAKLLPSVIVMALVTLDLVVGFAEKAARYGDWMRRFIQLERQLEAIRGKATDEDLAKITDERLAIEAGEPPVLHVLNAICYNEMVRTMGYGDKVKISTVQRLLAQFFDWREHQLT